MTGLDPVKDELDALIDSAIVARRRQMAGLPQEPIASHLVFTGNPGTGKTTVAHLIASAYHAAGILPKDTVVPVSRKDLVGGYQGQTAAKTAAVFDSARGGVLLIDEAYSLNGGPHDDYGKEAQAVLLAQAEAHRDDTVVILAGYGSEDGTADAGNHQSMDAFFASNPGLRSRFSRTIHFPDYSRAELATIARKQLAAEGNTFADPAASKAFSTALSTVAARGTGNARDVRQLLQHASRARATRIASDPTASLTTLTAADFTRAGELMESSLPPKGALVPTGRTRKPVPGPRGGT